MSVKKCVAVLSEYEINPSGEMLICRKVEIKMRDF